MSFFQIAMVLTAIDKASQVVRAFANKSMEDLHKLQKKFQEVGEKMQEMGKKSMIAGAAMTAPVAGAIKAFADLEEAQAFLKTTMMDASGKVGEEYEKLLKLADKLGTELPGSTKDMIEMFIALREQGVQTKNILGGVGEAAAKFAVLMKLPFKEAATYVAKFQEAMGVAEDQMVQFMDILQRLKFASGIEVGDLAYSFRYMGASLKMLGIQGLDAAKQISAVLGLMAANAIEGSTAGTSLAQAFARMAEVSHRMDSKRLQEFLAPLKEKGLHLEFFTKEGKFKGIEAMIAELEKLRVLSEQERLIVLEKLFGMEAARPLSVLIEKGFEGYKEMLKRMDEQADMQKKIAEITGTTKQKWDAFMGTLQNTMAYFGGLTANALQLGKIFEWLNDLLDRINKWMMAHKTLTGIIGASIVTVGGALFVFGGAMLALGFAVKLLGTALVGFRAFISILQVARGWIILTRIELLRLFGVQKLLEYISYHGGAWKALQFWLFTTRLRIIEAVGAMRVWIATQIAAFRAHFLTLTGLKNLALAMGGFFLSSLKKVIAGLRLLRLAFLTNPIGILLTGLALAAGFIIIHWKAVSTFFKGVFQRFKEVGVLVKVVKWVVSAVGSAFQLLMANWKRVLQVFMWVHPLTLPWMVLSKVVKMITGLNLYEAGAKIIRTLWEGMKAMASKSLEVMKNIVQKIRNMLPFSPAKEGPLTDIHRIRLVETIAQSLSPEPLLSKMKGVLSQVAKLSAPMGLGFSQALAMKTPMKGMPPSPALARASAMAGIGHITIHQTLNLSDMEPGQAKQVASQVATMTREAIFKAIDEYFRRKGREKAIWG